MCFSFLTNQLFTQLAAENSAAPSLKKQFYFDLTMRSRGGIFVYLATWILTATWSGLFEVHPFAFYLNTFIIIFISIMRTAHYVLYHHYDLKSKKMHNLLVLLILLGALHWGLLSAWIAFFCSISSLHYLYMIIISAFALGGSAILSISTIIRNVFALFIYLPSLITGFIVGNEEIIILAVLLIITLLYIAESTKFSYNDYWSAITNAKASDDKAKQLKKLSITDSLTGIYNRMYFNDSLNHEWKRCSRLQSSLSIMLIDLDHFKNVNDNFGHLAGDGCLKKIGEVLKSEIRRDTDVIARYGGEEFVVLLPDTNLVISTLIAENLVKKVASVELTWETKKIHLSCSIGLASVIPNREMNSEELLKAADETMYQAKKQGRNQVCVYQSAGQTGEKQTIFRDHLTDLNDRGL